MKIEKLGEDKFICNKPNLTIITFDNIFNLVVLHVINIIYNIYGDLKLIRKLNSDVKKIITHALLEQIYSRMIKENDINIILYINTRFTTFSAEIWDYIEIDKLEQFIIKICKIISKKAPLPIYVEEGTIDLLDDCGETSEIVYKIENALGEFKKQTTSISKLKKFSKDNGLRIFMDKYHPEDNKMGFFYYKYLKGTKHE